MIVYHKNQEIDREQWDNCIRNSSCIKPYPYSWYLDIMSPGWEALVDDDYDSVFPVPSAQRFGIQYVKTPSFVQQLGAFSPDKPLDKAIVEFLYYLPDFYKLIDLNISQKIDISGFKVTERTNRILDLSRPYELIEADFTSHCKRSIETAEKKGVELLTGISPDELLDLFILNRGKEIKDVKPRDYQRMRNLMNFCIKNKKGKLLGIRSGRKKLIFGLFLIETHGCKTIAMMSGTRQAIEKHLDHFSLNEIIRTLAGSKNCLDFAIHEGNGDASFADSFGAETKKYYRIYRNRLLVPARILR